MVPSLYKGNMLNYVPEELEGAFVSSIIDVYFDGGCMDSFGITAAVDHFTYYTESLIETGSIFTYEEMDFDYYGDLVHDRFDEVYRDVVSVLNHLNIFYSDYEIEKEVRKTVGSFHDNRKPYVNEPLLTVW